MNTEANFKKDFKQTDLNNIYNIQIMLSALSII